MDLNFPEEITVASPKAVKATLLAFIEATKEDPEDSEYNIKIDKNFVRHLEELLKGEAYEP